MLALLSFCMHSGWVGFLRPRGDHVRLLGLIVALLALGASTLKANAGGMNLSWGEGCWADNPKSVQTFACNTNAGSFSMTASAMPSRDLPLFVVFDLRLDLQSDSAELPDWWQLCGNGGCRTGSLIATGDFNSAPGGCVYVWPGQSPSASFNWRTAEWCGGSGVSPLPPNRAEIQVNIANSSLPSLHVGTEYYACRLTFNVGATTGAGGCGGCSVPATIVLNEIDLYGAAAFEYITTPLANTCLRWQASGSTPCSATTVRNMTWGAIKSFYR